MVKEDNNLKQVNNESGVQPETSATVRVNGQTFSVVGSGRLSKDIKTDNQSTHVNIVVRDDSNGQTPSSNSSVDVQSNSESESL